MGCAGGKKKASSKSCGGAFYEVDVPPDRSTCMEAYRPLASNKCTAPRFFSTFFGVALVDISPDNNALESADRYLDRWATLHWASALIAIPLSLNGLGSIVLCLSVAQMMASLVFDKIIAMLLLQYLVANRARRVQDEGALQQWFQSYSVSGLSTCFSTWLVSMGLNAISAPDETLDAGTAGSARLTGIEKARWVAGWQTVPCLGGTIASSGPAPVLWFIFAIGLMYQVVLFLFGEKRLAAAVFDDVEIAPLAAFKWRSELTSLGVASNLLRCIDASGELKPQLAVFCSKILFSNMWQSYFAISLLAVKWPTSTIDEQILTIGSICTGMVSSMNIGFQALLKNRGASRSKFIQRHARTWLLFFAALTLIDLPCLVWFAIIPMNVVRFIGIWYCPSGILNLTSGCIPI